MSILQSTYWVVSSGICKVLEPCAANMSTLILMECNMLLLKQIAKKKKKKKGHNWEFARQQRLFPEIMTQLLKLILKLGFQALLWRKSFFLPNNRINLKKKKKMRASPLRTENREVFPSTWKTTSRRDSVLTAPSLRRRRAGHARPPKILFKERRASVSNWEARHKVLSKVRQQQDKWNRVHSCLWLTAPKCLVSLPNSFGKKG